MRQSARRRACETGVLSAVLLCGAHAVSALTIEFDYAYDTGNFFAANPAARSTLEAAGAYFASRIGDHLLAIDSAGSNHFTARFTHPTTGVTVELDDFDIAADTIRVFPGAHDLGGSILGRAAAGSSSVSGTAQFVLDATTRGQGGFDDVSGTTAHEYALWGGAMAFDADSNWNFALASGPAPGQYDFLSVALHEFGHLFGVGVAQSWFNHVVDPSAFDGEAATLVYGQLVPLQVGSEQHWREGVTSAVAGGPEAFIGNAGAAQETSFDPTLTVGHRKLITDLDLAALSDIGWEMSEPAPVPIPAGLSWLTALLLLAMSRRRLGRQASSA